jgi:serine/threonine protein kinase
LTKRGAMSMDEWRKSPQSARNNPKLSPERAQQIADEAIAGGQKWDVQEKINARRQAELNTECGLGLGKVLGPAKFDALVPKPRCQAGEGAFGTYFVHPSEKYGVKLFSNGDEDDVGFEFDMLDRARAAGVNAPDPLSMNAVRDIDGEIRSQTLVLSHMKGYSTINSLGWSDGQGRASRAPLITKVKLAREFRKLHTEGLAHGDIHSGNIMASAVSKKPALIDFGYATNLDSYHPGHGRSGIQNLMVDLNRLPEFLGLPGNGKEFRARYKGVLDNIKTQATNWDMGVQRSQSWDRFEVGVKRYHDALESELLGQEGLKLPRSRFISGADQPRIPGLTRGILTANVNTAQREILENLAAQGEPSFLKPVAKGLGIKPPSLERALQPERDARLAKQRRQPFGTRLKGMSKAFGTLGFSTPTIRTRSATPKPNKTPAGMFRVKPGTPTGMRRVKPGVDEFTGLFSWSLQGKTTSFNQHKDARVKSSAATRSPSRTPAARAPRNWFPTPLGTFGSRTRSLAADLPANPRGVAGRLSLAARMRRIRARSGNEDMSMEAAMRLARAEQRG